MEKLIDIITIVKIREGFFIGDLTAGTNLEIIEEYKITHIINATDNNYLNHFEKKGIKYLTLNWLENSKQQLFTLNDENFNNIMKFIEKNEKNGEGLLVFSIKCQNRACIVAIIYLIKIYNWSVSKCIEYIKSKKINISIPSYFIKQLNDFEIRISSSLKIKKSLNWEVENNKIDYEEFIMRNTYINSVIYKKKSFKIFNNKKFNKSIPRKVKFLDVDKKENVLVINNENDLFLKKKIEDINNHILMKPQKSCLKSKNKKNQNLNLNYAKNDHLYVLFKKKEKPKENININNIIANISYLNDIKYKKHNQQHKKNLFLKISPNKTNLSFQKNNLINQNKLSFNLPIKIDSYSEKKNNNNNNNYPIQKNRLSNSCNNIFNHRLNNLKLPLFSPHFDSQKIQKNYFNQNQDKFIFRIKKSNNVPIKINNNNQTFNLLSPKYENERKDIIWKNIENDILKRPLSTSKDKKLQMNNITKVKRSLSPMVKSYNLRYYNNENLNNSQYPDSILSNSIGNFIKLKI